MKFNWYTAIGLVFVGVFAILFISNNGQGQVESNVLLEDVQSNGVIAAENDTHEFGIVSMKDGDVSHWYELKNASEESVRLGEIYTSCMCTTARVKYSDGTTSRIVGMRGHGARTYLDRAIQPGESFQVEAVFDPAAHGPSGVGPIHRSVYIQTNSSQSPQLELTFDANVTR